METPLEKAYREVGEARAQMHKRMERGRRVQGLMYLALAAATLAAIVPWELLFRGGADMQEMRAPTGEIHREFAAGKKGEIEAHFAKRRAELEAQGYVYVGQGKVSPNAKCPCKSGMKFKRCCISRVVRAGGGTFVRGVLDTTGLPTATVGEG